MEKSPTETTDERSQYCRGVGDESYDSWCRNVCRGRFCKGREVGPSEKFMRELERALRRQLL